MEEKKIVTVNNSYAACTLTPIEVSAAHARSMKVLEGLGWEFQVLWLDESYPPEQQFAIVAEHDTGMEDSLSVGFSLGNCWENSDNLELLIKATAELEAAQQRRRQEGVCDE